MRLAHCTTELSRRSECCREPEYAVESATPPTRLAVGQARWWRLADTSSIVCAVADPKLNPLVPLAALGFAALALRPTRRDFPLLGITIAVTRDTRRVSGLSQSLQALGASVVQCPTIEIIGAADPTRLDDALARAEGFDWIVFTSANGVERTIDRLLASGKDVRSFGAAKLAAIGPATAEALRARGLRVDVVPDEYVAESLFSALETVGPLAGAHVLLARAAVARDVLPDALRAAGAVVEVVEAYRTVVPEDAAATVHQLLESPDRILVTFTSSSTVTNFKSLATGTGVSGLRAACIGPITATTARDSGFSVVVEATTFTTAGLVDAIVDWAKALESGQAEESA